jgi:two-component system, NarL family, response regulator YdfI
VIRVWIIAASSFTRAGLESLLAPPQFSVAGSSAGLDALVGEISDTEPDAVLMDASGENADVLLHDLAASGVVADIPVILLRDQPRPDWTAKALRAGIRAILPTGVSADQLAAALQAATAGLFIVHPLDLSSALSTGPGAASRPAELPEPLTPREREVLQRLASGLANKQIAGQLQISEHTVKFHVASILGKLGAGTRTEAVSIGIRYGLVLL